MRRLFSITLALFLTISGLGQQKKGEKCFGPRYSECLLSELHQIESSLNGQKDAVKMRVPGLFKNKMRREIIKLSANEDDQTRAEARKLADGLQEIYYVSYERCSAAFRDSLNRSIKARIKPSANVYDKDSVYLFGFRTSTTSDTIKCLLMYMEAQSTVIYMTGDFLLK